MDFPQMLNAIMSERKITAYRIAKDTGISNTLIGYWRKGTKKPTKDNLVKIAAYFNVSVDYLLGIEKKAASETPPLQEAPHQSATPEHEDYISIMGNNGVQMKIPVPTDKLERFKTLLKAGLPELLDDEKYKDL